MKAMVIIDIPDKLDVKSPVEPFNTKVILDYGDDTVELEGKLKEIEEKEEETVAKDVIMDNYNNFMRCPHCGEIIGVTSDWTPNYCSECGKPLSGGNGRQPDICF